MRVVQETGENVDKVNLLLTLAESLYKPREFSHYIGVASPIIQSGSFSGSLWLSSSSILFFSFACGVSVSHSP